MLGDPEPLVAETLDVRPERPRLVERDARRGALPHPTELKNRECNHGRVLLLADSARSHAAV